MKRTSILIASILSMSLVAGTVSVTAQQRGPGWGMMERGWPMDPSRMGMMRMMGDCPMMGTSGQAAAFIEGRIAFLRAELAITDSQKSAWEAYASATKRNIQSMQGMWESMHTALEGKSPVERLDAHLAAMEARVKALKDVQPALVKLYDALDAEQKEKANEILTGMGCMM